MNRRLIIALEVTLVGVALFLADLLQANINVIPKSIVHLPDVTYTRADFWTVVKYFLLTHLACFAVVQWRVGPWDPANGKRTIDALFTLAAAFALSALGVFVTTTVAFDPNFIVLIALINAILFLLVFVLAAVFGPAKIKNSFLDLAAGLVRKTFSVTGILVLLLAVSPAILAKLFTSDRDIANIITSVRIYFSDTLESNYSLINKFDGLKFEQPMLAKSVPLSPGDIFVLERPGRLVLVNYSLPDQKVMVLDISDKVGYTEVENGTLGFAFHPEYGQEDSAEKNSVYVHYTSVGDGTQVNRLSKFDLGSGDLENRSLSELPLMTLPREPSGFHNGGSVEFGPDGFLYVAIGEGVHPKDVYSQSDALRQGIMRIDVDQQGGSISHSIRRQPANGGSANYYIPSDNPFIGNAELLEEYWAIGLRNPFRIAFDAKTGDLWAGDVGSTEWEEINLITKAGNYQFPYKEGYVDGSKKRPANVLGDEYPPVFTYVHTAFDRAVIGGVVYRGTGIEELDGMYIFADNYSAKIFKMPSHGKQVDDVDVIVQADQFAQRGVSSVSQLADGSLVVTTLGRAGSISGEVLTLTLGAVPASSNKSEIQPKLELSKSDIDEIFVSNCSRCHGRDGAGNGPDAELLQVEIASFSSTEFQKSRTDQDLIKIIAEGGQALGMSALMPPWSQILEDEEIEGLVEKIRSMAAEPE